MEYECGVDSTDVGYECWVGWWGDCGVNRTVWRDSAGGIGRKCGMEEVDSAGEFGKRIRQEDSAGEREIVRRSTWT